MGLKHAPDFAQQIMEQVLCSLVNVFVYLDDISIFSKTWEDHLLTIKWVLSCFKANGFTITPIKCQWVIQQTDWIGYLLTLIGLELWKKCISLNHNLHVTSRKCMVSDGLSSHIRSCGLNGPICLNLSLMNLTNNLFVGPQKSIKLSKSWKPFWLRKF